MVCDLCAKKGPTSKVRVEGVVYDVCSDCASLGVAVKQASSRKSRSSRRDPDADLVVRSDVATRLRKARGSIKMDDFAKKLRVKESDLHAWETGHRTPTIDTAKRLQKQLNISLVQQQATIEGDEYKPQNTSGGSLTIGDMLKDKL
jgi:uncharacterized protein (TIGR00270 family)